MIALPILASLICTGLACWSLPPFPYQRFRGQKLGWEKVGWFLALASFAAPPGFCWWLWWLA